MLANDDLIPADVAVTVDANGNITTRPNLDDYFFLPGRVGGQVANGGKAAGEFLTLVASAGATAFSSGAVDFRSRTRRRLDQIAASGAPLTADAVIGTYDLTSGAGGGLIALQVSPTLNYTVSGGGEPLSLFKVLGTMSLQSSSGNHNVAAQIMLLNPTMKNDAARSLSFLGFRAVIVTPTFTTDSSGNILTISQMAIGEMIPTLNTGTAVTTARGIWMRAWGGSGGTIGTIVGLDFDNESRATNQFTVRSSAAGAQMRHAGDAVFGANAGPSGVSVGLEVQSTTKALLLSRMTGAQAAALTPLDGMEIYVTDNAGAAPFNTGPGFFFYDAGAWVKK